MDYGKRFKFYRERMKLTQKEAALKIGIKDYQLGNYETNRSEPSLDILKKMSKTYQVSVDKLLGNNPLPNKYIEEVKEDDYIDTDELLKSLNDIVGKINEANNKK